MDLRARAELRLVAASFVAPGPCGVAVRDRLKHLTPEDEDVLRLVGAHLGSLASRDLMVRCADGLDHCAERWAARKRELTAVSSSRWAGSITKASNDQWALARRGQVVHVRDLEAGIRTVGHRLSLPVGAKGTRRAPGGYRSRRERHAKSRRLGVLEDRLAAVRTDRDAGRVRVVRGGRRLLNTRHHLGQAQLTEDQWRARWEAERWFLAADGESGKRFGNETIRVTPDGEVSVKLPPPLAWLANAPRGRYILAGRVAFAHRGQEWADRLATNRAVAYRIHLDVQRGRWYLTASWQRPVVPTMPLEAARTRGMIGVDMNADHLAAWQLDVHGNPTGDPHRFPDAEMTEFFSDIAQEMQDRFGISRAEAVARLNQAWGGQDFDPYPDIVCHEDPEYWARYFYYEGDVPYWDDTADRSQWRPTPPPPADSDAWTLPREA